MPFCGERLQILNGLLAIHVEKKLSERRFRFNERLKPGGWELGYIRITKTKSLDYYQEGMKMKKIAAWVLVVFLTISAVGCGTMSELAKQPNEDAKSDSQHPTQRF